MKIEILAIKRAFSGMALAVFTVFGGCGGGSGDSSGERAFVVNGGSGSISVIDVESRSVVSTFELNSRVPGTTWPHHIYFSPNESRIAVAAPGVDLSAGHEGEAPNGGGAHGGAAATLRMSDSLGAGEPHFIVLDTSGGIIKAVPLEGMNHNAAFSPDGSEIWTTHTEGGMVLVFDATSFNRKNEIPVGKEPLEVTFSADGSSAFVANSGSANVSVIDISSKSVIGTVPVGEGPVGAWPGEDNHMYTDNEQGQSITEIDVASRKALSVIDLGFMPAYAAYNLSTEELWVTNPEEGMVHLYSKKSGAWSEVGSVESGPGAHAISFTRDFTEALVTNQEGASVSVIDAVLRKHLTTIPVGIKPNGIVVR